MPLEKRLVDGDVLQSHHALLGLKLQDPVHQKKRIPVRQKPQNVRNAIDEIGLRQVTLFRFRSCYRVRQSPPVPPFDSAQSSLLQTDPEVVKGQGPEPAEGRLRVASSLDETGHGASKC